jgi:23S rRNA (uracil1939-C5)-methyltransferase
VWGYRRRARLAARWVPKKNRTVVGFRERNTPYVADLKQCDVLQAPVGSLLEPLSTVLSALSIRNRVPQVEVAVGDNAIAMVIRVLEPPTAADLERLREFGREHRVQIHLQPGGYETIAPLSEGVVPLEYHLPAYDVGFEFLPSDFVQVNAALNAQMVERAVELLAPRSSDRVLDLFCGLGNFSLPLARSGAQVTGIEGDAALIARARVNARRNGLERVEFHSADLANASLCAAPWALRPYDKVLLDPPRAGAQEVLPVIARSGASTVLYISCHPGSLARDAGILVHEHGFGLSAAGVMDMFPHTAHVESAALFLRSG